MNALAATAPGLNGLAGLSPSPRAGDAAGALPAAAFPVAGFVNLINALLGQAAGSPDEKGPEDGAEAAQPALEDAPRTVSDATIAQALIRSMLGGRAVASTSGAIPSDAKASRKRSPSLAPSASPGLPITLDVAIERAAGESATSGMGADAGANSKSAGASPQGQLQVASLDLLKTPLSQAPLAFTARLTPFEGAGLGDETPLAPALAKAAIAEEKTAVDRENKAAQLDPASRAESSDSSRDETSRGENVARVAATASASDFAGAFDNQTQPGDWHSRIADSKMDSTFGAVADTLRHSESRVAPGDGLANAASSGSPGASPVQEIALRIAQPQMPQVDLRITERAGEIHVAVRTPDAALEGALRQDLGTLANSLERAGYRTETFVPRESGFGDGMLKGPQSSHMNSRDDPQQDARQQDARQQDSGNHRQQQRQREPRTPAGLNRRDPLNELIDPTEMEKQS